MKEEEWLCYRELTEDGGLTVVSCGRQRCMPLCLCALARGSAAAAACTATKSNLIWIRCNLSARALLHGDQTRPAVVLSHQVWLVCETRSDLMIYIGSDLSAELHSEPETLKP